MIYDPPCGLTISTAIGRACGIAKRTKRTVTLRFNGRNFAVKPTSTADEVYFQWERQTGSY